MAATERFLEASEELASRILDQELELNAAPSAEGINQLVDLYSKAIEYYEFRGDARYKNLQTRLQSFLARPDMQATLQRANSPPKPRHHKRVLSYDEQARHQPVANDDPRAGCGFDRSVRSRRSCIIAWRRDHTAL